MLMSGVLAALACAPLMADTAYFQRTFFDNSLTPDAYFHSQARVVAPSTLELIKGKLPVESSVFVTPPNALRLHWTSKPGGEWEAELQLYEWRNRPVNFPGNVLTFAVWSADRIAGAALPQISLRDKARNFSGPLDLATFVPVLQAKRWTWIHIPMAQVRTASIHPFDFHQTTAISFSQKEHDAAEHTLILDEFRIDTLGQHDVRPEPPVNVVAKGYERHIDISWSANGPEPERWIIYRSDDGKSFTAVGTQVRDVHRYEDWIGKPGLSATYKVSASNANYTESAKSASANAATRRMTDEELMTMVQEACFRYYWERAHPVAGMTLESFPGDDRIVATGASGFGIMALVVGVDRGFITREQGAQRLRRIVTFLEHADRYHGVWPHFLDGATGKRMPVFDMFDNGADIVETSFLMEGLLTARQYFKTDAGLYDRISALWKAVEWDWFRKSVNGPALLWHWSPEYTWYINHPLYGWNEVMISYLLAIASPTHGVPPRLYLTGWAGDAADFINKHTYYGIKLDLGSGTGGPLFFTHYSYMGFDPHSIGDKFTRNYFDNNANMAKINYEYCRHNPGHHSGYGPGWGITAVDGPKGYVPYEPTPRLDDGTIAPTGAIASMPYTPEKSLAVLKYFYREQGSLLWDVYGFRDAFNLDQDWVSRINMGLNQAPMVVMIENYRTGLIWKNFMANPEIAPMIKAIASEQ